MDRIWVGIGAMACSLSLPGLCAAAPPAPPPRPAEFLATEASAPLPPPRPAEFATRREAAVAPWRPRKLIQLARLQPEGGPRLADAPGLVLQFAAPKLQPLPASPEELKVCDALLAGQKAIATRLLPVAGPNGCGVAAPISLSGLHLPDGRFIRIEPPLALRCDLAARAVDWLADTVIPAVERQGGRVKSIVDAGGYQCRNRNHSLNGKLSEHAVGDAIDLIGVRFEDGHMLNFSALDNDMAVAQDLRETACARFATVLGPGSDGAHESHVHLDLEARGHGAKLCEWNLR
jgi:hypothetical protein